MEKERYIHYSWLKDLLLSLVSKHCLVLYFPICFSNNMTSEQDHWWQNWFQTRIERNTKPDSPRVKEQQGNVKETGGTSCFKKPWVNQIWKSIWCKFRSEQKEEDLYTNTNSMWLRMTICALSKNLGFLCWKLFIFPSMRTRSMKRSWILLLKNWKY